MPPRIVTARSIGLEFRANKLAAMGPETSVVGHYSAGARAKNLAQGIARAKEFHAFHLSKGWAGIGYHYVIDDKGNIICCRSTFHVGAHVLNNNSGRIGINMPGTLTETIRDKPTRMQARAYHWLLHNAHTDAMPRLHRTDRDLSKVPLTVHNKLMATSCPGLFMGMYLKGGEPWIEPGDGGPLAEEPDDEFVEPTAEDEAILADLEEGRLPGPEADEETTGPDDHELQAEAAGDEAMEAPEPDDEFDEDLSDVLAEAEEELRQPQG